MVKHEHVNSILVRILCTRGVFFCVWVFLENINLGAQYKYSEIFDSNTG